MAETRPEFGSAVADALRWMEASPETAGPVLGINARTLSAMAQGIVPMRSLIIRFAEAVARQCARAGGAPDWWSDVDAWLNVAGYPPRRDLTPDGRPAGGAPHPEPPPFRPVRPPAPAPLQSSATSGQPVRPTPPPPAPPSLEPEGPPAREFYRPQYERKPVNDSFAHVFWILDPEGRKVFRLTYAPRIDYKARAAEVKRDLESLSRERFERKYGRFRVQGQAE